MVTVPAGRSRAQLFFLIALLLLLVGWSIKYSIKVATPRKDGLVWNRDDLRDNDGTHPSPSGQRKVADMLVKFFHSDPFAKTWYLK